MEQEKNENSLTINGIGNIAHKNTTNKNSAKYYPPLIKISCETNVKSAIDFVLEALKHRESILICGLSLAISKVILVAEIVKSKVEKIHQINNIDCLITTDKFGNVKRVPKLDILLSLSEPEAKGLGYQPPIKSYRYLSNTWKIKDINEDVSKIITNNKGRRIIILGHRRKGPKLRIRK